ncbi:MAG: menaquinone biosynthesis protein [Verrucomicrobiota bacterium]|nr:menaquinone biosynthesis protein [Verrucomicrobiota bacterium]
MTNAAGRRLRLGCVQYLNARPLIDGWPGEVSFDHPAALCDRLAARDLDVALVSSFEFLRAPIYTVVDRIAIGSDGPVFSVFVAYRGELATSRSIQMDPASRTSVNLLRCIFGELNLSTPFVAATPAEIAENPEDVGRLIIGDQAIRFRQRHGDAYRYLDLGERWRAITGLPFVYALWLIRPEVADRGLIAAQLRALRDGNIARLDDLAATHAAMSPEFCRFYWRECLKFDFGEREQAGLLKFRSLCQKHGILERTTAPLRLA